MGCSGLLIRSEKLGSEAIPFCQIFWNSFQNSTFLLANMPNPFVCVCVCLCWFCGWSWSWSWGCVQFCFSFFKSLGGNVRNILLSLLLGLIIDTNLYIQKNYEQIGLNVIWVWVRIQFSVLTLVYYEIESKIVCDDFSHLAKSGYCVHLIQAIQHHFLFFIVEQLCTNYKVQKIL